MSLLYNFNQSAVIEKVTMKWPCDEYIIPAGTPMSKTGIANDKNAIGILASEARIRFNYPLSVAPYIGKEEPKGKKDYTFSIITSGFVNLTDAEESFGAKISEEAKAAMGGINFVNEDEPASFGGGSGASGGSGFKDIVFNGVYNDEKQENEYTLEYDGKTFTGNYFDGTCYQFNTDEDYYEFLNFVANNVVRFVLIQYGETTIAYQMNYITDSYPIRVYRPLDDELQFYPLSAEL